MTEEKNKTKNLKQIKTKEMRKKNKITIKYLTNF